MDFSGQGCFCLRIAKQNKPEIHKKPIGDNFQCFAPKTSQTIEVFGNNSKILPPKSKSQN